jgi:co-chaperonin GroES (HSP10)
VQSQEQPDDTVWVTPIEQSKPAATTNRRRIARTAGILGVGVAAGGVLAFGLNANASPRSTSTGVSAAASQYGAVGENTANFPRGGRNRLALSGTVTAVGSNSVTIRTSSGTIEYVVDSKSDIDKNGEAKLADLKVGDVVHFSTITTNGKATIDKLFTGDHGGPGGPGPGGPGGQSLSLSGTVTAVGSASVTIKTSTGTTEYVVDAKSDIDKNGEAKLADLKVGDAVTFNTVTTNGKATIDKLHSGDEAKNRPAGPPPGQPGTGPGGA